MFERFRPYFALLKRVKGRFAASMIAGVIYAAASGFGMPFLLSTVFPVIFGQAQSVLDAREALVEAKGEEEATRIIEKAFPGKLKTAEKQQEIAVRFEDFAGKENAGTWLLIAACAVMPIAFLIRGAAGFLNVYWTTQCGLEVLKDIQQKVFDKLQRLPLGFFSGKKTGDLISRVMGDTQMMNMVVTTVANDIIKQPLTLVSALGFLAYSSWQSKESFFLLLCLISIPICVLPIRLVGKKLMLRAAVMQKTQGDNTAVLSETLGAAREIRAFNLEDLMAGRFLSGLARWTKLHLKVIKYRFLAPPAIEFVSAIVVSAALFYGARQHLTLEAFIPLVAALYMCYDPMKKLGEVHNRLKQGGVSLDRLEEILNAPESTPDPVAPAKIENVNGAITFHGVSFSYGDSPALKDINVEIPAGQIVALVGPSGAGKTTFASLVPRFYDPLAGSIRLDGTDLREVRKKDLRDHITLVPQEAVLFSDTIEANIRLGREGASKEQVLESARQANAHDFIVQQPHGYETQVGERGAQLSGGQKQRISIARAFLRNAPVLILDEATSALDSESEARIQQELAALARGRTTLIIAHRFSTIRIADRILVFEGGRIVGDGTFAELEKSHDLFRLLLEQQRH
ncbi:ABC transporter ATP-binding protein [Luteolibacter ambystomatis]|uniref:ABC transporter ATP-binding protein n=1 Tax=Luteolibacter ambystomatis TaxID=2824561 RepID=A0A975G734_9BACT|nr:ABC transporter ATP-binding protein [Luteolibacter ambystomatis]QUE50163.1 ABC transporter ATP-binding protein [Luteolibacter ambystomatis]